MKKLLLFAGLALSGMVSKAQNYASELVLAGPCDPSTALLCPSGVENPGNVVDADRNNFALLKSNLGVSLIENTAFIEVAFTNPAPAGSAIGFEIGELNENLNVDVLENLVVRVYDSNGSEVQTFGSISLTDLGVLSSGANINRLLLTTEIGAYEIASVRVELTSVVSLAQQIALYSVYTDNACPAVAANQVLNSQSAVNTDAAVDNDPASFASLSVPLGLAQPASLQLEFPVPALPGDYVGFKVSKDQTLLNLGLIENLSIVAYSAAGVELERRNDFVLADLTALELLSPILAPVLGLAGGEEENVVLGFATSSTISEPIASVAIESTSLLAVGYDLSVFGGFFFSTSNGLQISATAPSMSEGEEVTLSAADGYDLYQWSTGEFGQEITITQAGIYTVQGIRFDGCPIAASIRILDKGCSEVNNRPNSIVAVGDCDPQTLLLCPSGVTNPENAIDGDSETFATLSSSIGVSLIESKAFIRMGFNRVQAPGTVYNFKVKALNEVLNADVLDQVQVVFFDEAGNEIFRDENIGVQDVQLLSAEGGLNNIQVTTPINIGGVKEIQLEVEALVNVLQEIALYDITTTCGCPAKTGVSIPTAVNVSDPQRIVDNDPNNFALMQPGLLASPAVLEVAFDNPAIGGDYVGYLVALENDLLAAGVLDNVTVELLDANGNVVVSETDFSLVDLVAAEQLAGTLGSLLGLSNGGLTPYLVGLEVPEGGLVTAIRLTLNPVVGVLQSIRVYNAIQNPRIQNITLTASSTSLCSTDQVTLSAPVGHASYLWSTGETTREIQISEAGLYSCQIGSINGCDFSGSVAISTDGLEIDVTQTQPNCNQANGVLGAVVPGPASDYTFEWSNGATSASITGITAGIYSVTVTEFATGCTGSDEILLSDIDAPEIPVWVRHANCGQIDGAIYLNLPAGATVNWSSGEDTPIIKRLAPGVYTAEITFITGCKRFARFRVINQSDFGISANITPSSCTEATGAIGITISSPGDYVYEWSNGADVPNLVGLAPGFYSVVVTNVASGCQDILELALSTEGAPIISELLSQEERCAREYNGILEVGVDAVNQVNVLWNTGETTLRIENLGPALYQVNVSDSAGCEANGFFPLPARDSLRGAAAADPTFCDPPFDGMVTTDVYGGRAPYSYVWSTGEVTDAITGLQLGDYNVEVTDVNGCPLNLEAFVDEDESCKNEKKDEDEDDTSEDDINNIFTPNGDGSNDTWVLGVDLDAYDAVALRVVNIYGTEVYEEGNYANNWKGTYRNSQDPLPDGTYYYDITLVRGGSQKQLKSYVIIKR